MPYWLMKSEPETFSIDDLIHSPNQITSWNGVRNYQVRNLLRDCINPGDRAFFYHSNCNPPAIVGIMEVVKAGYPDTSAFDPQSGYYDPASQPAQPRWYMVDVQFVRKLKRVISLQELKQHKILQNMPLLKKGNRLSIVPVTQKEWEYILSIE